MASITVDDGGTPRVITDIAPLLTEQADIVRRLERIYVEFERRPASALDSQEPVIVTLVNRYNTIGDWIDQLTALDKRRDDIAAGWDLLQRLHGERS